MINSRNIPITDLGGGLNISKPPISLPPNFTPNCNNIIITDNEVRKRNAFTYYSKTDTDNPPDKLIMGHAHWESHKETSKKFMRFGIDYVDGSADIPRVHWVNSGAWTEVADDFSTAAGTIATGTYDYWSNYCKVIKAGIEYHILNITPTANNITAGTLPVSLIMNSDMSNSWATIGTHFRAKRVLSFWNRLLLLGACEPGTSPAVNSLDRVIWSATLDFTDFDPVLDAYLDDTAGAILNGAVVGENVICLKEDSLWVGTPLSEDPHIRWRPRYPDVGLMAPRLMAQYGNAIYFVGTNGVYVYAGGSELYNIGKKIWTKILDDIKAGGQDDNRLYKRRGFASVHRDKGHILFWLPTTTSPWPTVAYVYNTNNNSWFRWELPTNSSKNLIVYGWGEYEHDATISGLEFTPFYGVSSETSSTPSGATSAYYDVTKYEDIDPNALTTATVAIDASIETIDMMHSLDEKSLWNRVFVEAKGLVASSPLLVSMSLDGGVNWETLTKTHTLVSTAYDSYLAKFNMTGYKCRFKFSDDTKSKAFALQSIEVQVGPDEAEEA